MQFRATANANGGPAIFSWSVTDNGGTANGGADTLTESLTINVTAVNDAPAGTDATVTTLEDTAYTFSTADFGFSDPDDVPANSLLAVKITALPAAGSLTDNGVAVALNQFISVADINSGLLKFTPAANANGASYASFTFAVQDNGGTANSGVDLDPTPNTITVNVTSVNDAPAGTDATVTTPEDTAYTFSTADFGFSDPDDVPANSLLAVKITALPRRRLAHRQRRGGGPEPVHLGGRHQRAACSSSPRRPTPTARATRASLSQSRTTVAPPTAASTWIPPPTRSRVDVTPVNDAPVANADAAAVQEDVTLAAAGDVLANDTDVDAGDTKTVSLVNGAAGNVGAAVAGTYGSVTIAANGTYTYSLNNAAAIVQALAAGQTVTDAFTYQVSDGSGATATATLTVTITGTNDAPVANADAAAVQEDVTLAAAGDVLANDTDVDAGDTKTVSLVNGAAGNVGAAVAGTYGSVTIAANGTYTYSLNNAAAIVQALAAGQTVTDAFTYQVSDGSGATATATLTVTITGTNDAPVANADAAAVQEDVTLAAAGDVLANDTDVDAGDTKTVSLVNGAAGNVGAAVAGTYGSVTIAANGTYTYSLNNAAAIVQALAAGQTVTDAFTYQVSDGSGATATATLTVTITGTNDAPVANADAAAVQEDVTLAAAGDVLANDTDVDAGDTKTVSLVNGAAGNVGAAVAGTYGSVTIAANGTYTYSLNNAAAIVQALAAGQTVTDAFTYQVSDGSGATATATLTVTITGTNDAPVANADAAAVQEDVTLAAAGDVLANDTDVDAGDTKTVSLVNGAAGNVGAAVAGTYGSVTIAANGTYTYSLNNAAAIVQALAAGQTVTDAFTYQVSDGSGATATATLTVTITGTNDAPVANADAAAVQEDVTLAAAGDVLANDTDVDAGDTKTVSLVNGAAGNVGAAVAGTYGSVTIAANGTYTYSLNNAAAIVQALAAGQTVTDAFTYQVSDGSGATATATLTVTITGTNDAPVANADAAAVQEDVTLAAAGDVLANDTDVDAGDTKTVSLVNGAAGNVGAAVAGTYGSVTIAANGTYTYSLNNAAAIVQALAAGQTVTDAFTYQVSDGSGATATATLTVTITGTNDAPVANADAAAVQEDVTLAAAGDVLANDTDVDAGDTKTVSLVNGAAGNVGAAVAGTYGSVTIAANGTYTYSLNNAAAIVQALAAGQTVTDAFTYQVSDGSGATATATLTVTITGTNDAPVNTVPGAQTPAEDTPLALTGVSINDADAEPLTVTVTVANGTLTVNLGGGAAVTGGTNGAATLTLAGTQAQLNAALASLTYQGIRDYNGPDTLTITTVDGAGAADTDSIAIIVTPVNDDPVLGNTIFTIDDGRTLTVTGANLSASDIDDAAGSLVFTVSSVTNGYFALASNPGAAITSFTQADIAAGLVQFKHDGSSLAPAFRVLVADPSGGSAGPVAATIVFNAGGPPVGGAAPSALPPITPTPIEPVAAPTAATVPSASPRATAFFRTPTEPPVDGGGDDGEENVVVPPQSTSASSFEKRMVAEVQLAGARGEADIVESKPLRSEIEVEPVRAEMQAIPTRHDLDLDDEERARIEVVLSAVRVSGIAFSIGAIWWAARAAGLIASLVSSAPAWRHVDPLPVLGRDDEEEEEVFDVADEDQDRKDDEHRAAWVLEER